MYMDEKTIEELNKRQVSDDEFGNPWKADVYCLNEEKPFVLYVPFGKTYEEYYSEKHKAVCPTCGNSNIVRIIVNKKDYLKREPETTDKSID